MSIERCLCGRMVDTDFEEVDYTPDGVVCQNCEVECKKKELDKLNKWCMETQRKKT